MKGMAAVIGAGSWGTTLALLLHKRGCRVSLWGRPEDNMADLDRLRENQRFLPGVKIPEQITVTDNETEAVAGAEAVIFAVPAQAFREVVERFRNHLSTSQLLVSAAKGIEQGTTLRMSQVLKEVLPADFWGRIAVLSGPSHAEEVARDIPTAVVAAAESNSVAAEAQDLFMTSRFRVYTNTDLVGVELGGALKNVIALGAGISDGLGYGDNTRAALITRGLAEIRRLGVALGAKELTFYGLSGLGDLVVTCNSMHSRNRRAGILLGQGMPLPEVLQRIGMVVEGVYTAAAAAALARKGGVEMPITFQVCEVLFNMLPPRQGVDNLMLRSPTREVEKLNDS